MPLSGRHSPRCVRGNTAGCGSRCVAARAAAAHFRHPGAHVTGRILCSATLACGAAATSFPQCNGKGMNSRVFHIATNTFREAVRDRVLYNLIAFALLLTGAAVLVGQISIDIEKLVVINLGLTAVSLFGIVIAIFIGIGLVSKEIDKRTLYTVLSRPVQRWEFVVGKFFGLAGTLIVNTFFMAIGVFAAISFVSWHHALIASDGWVLLALYFIVLEFVIITALALFFSSF